MNLKKVLITDDVHPALINGLQELGYIVDFSPEITFSETKSIITTYEGLIINSKIVCAQELLDEAVNLRWIGRLGSGMEVIDTKICDEKGIAYFNSPEGNCNAVAEHALGLLLALLRNIVKANKEVKQNLWIREPNRGEELSGKIVGILGYGHTGFAFSKVLRGFDVKILAYDKYKSGFESEATLEQIFEEADVLSLHLPLTEETCYWINADFLSKFRKPIYLINTSRGKVLQTESVFSLLEIGKIKGLALDVLENEKLETLIGEERKIMNKLQNSDRIILSSHIAGWTHESKLKIAETLLYRIKASVC